MWLASSSWKYTSFLIFGMYLRRVYIDFLFEFTFPLHMATLFSYCYFHRVFSIFRSIYFSLNRELESLLTYRHVKGKGSIWQSDITPLLLKQGTRYWYSDCHQKRQGDEVDTEKKVGSVGFPGALGPNFSCPFFSGKYCDKDKFVFKKNS